MPGGGGIEEQHFRAEMPGGSALGMTGYLALRHWKCQSARHSGIGTNFEGCVKILYMMISKLILMVCLVLLICTCLQRVQKINLRRNYGYNL